MALIPLLVQAVEGDLVVYSLRHTKHYKHECVFGNPSLDVCTVRVRLETLQYGFYVALSLNEFEA